MTMLKGIIVALVLSFSLSADPVDVSYLVTGSTGDWTLDFSVTNNLSSAPNQNFYFFGVLLSSSNITGVPTNFAAITASYDPFSFGYGGSDTEYNNVWYDSKFSDGLQLPGTTTSGFDVTISDAVAPTSVQWFAFTADTLGASSYTGGGNFNTAFNPLFEGDASAAGTSVGGTSAVPEPSMLAFLGVGLAALVASRRKAAGFLSPK
jgi:PEP-CTERM motif-containing protein